jgi:AraC-like DNA-binding protein
MKEICDRVMHWLTTTGAYTNPDLSLSMLSVETGISPTNLSGSINGYLKKNFFDIINEMRIEEAKKMLCSNDDNFTIDSVAAECGFRSRSTFYVAFKKAEGKTPAQWRKEVEHEEKKMS